MSETATLALVGILGTILAGTVTQYFNTQQRREDRKKWYAEFFLKEHILHISNLASSIVDTDQLLYSARLFLPYESTEFTFKDFNTTMNPSLFRLIRHFHLAAPYLDEQTRTAAKAYITCADKAQTALLYLHFKTDPDTRKMGITAFGVTNPQNESATDDAIWAQLGATYEPALTAVTNHLNPPTLKGIVHAKW